MYDCGLGGGLTEPTVVGPPAEGAAVAGPIGRGPRADGAPTPVPGGPTPIPPDTMEAAEPPAC
ncbi:hypothetical protein Hamer_G012510 [Homarus americanus]|uniref:Uncharacterized protein n=1 Tax=Homarus americanus TaxID=6706 RepID=A0A8J5KHI3_HOMAM|nr:hypothetical protein Hamer_G012510 [Homarus americanus]